jgi:hypothetical protein
MNVNGKVAKSCLTIRICELDNKLAFIPIVSSVFSTADASVCLLYGIAPNLVVERVPLKGHEGSVITLRRADPRKLSASLATSQVVQVKPLTANAKKSSASKHVASQGGSVESDPSLMEMLQADLDANSRHEKKVTTEYKVRGGGTSQSILLIQALSSKDNVTLSHLYSVSNAQFIRNSVKTLRGPQAFVLFKDLMDRLDRSGSDSRTVAWLKETISVHMHYLQSCKGIEVYFDRVSKLANQERRLSDKIRHVTAKLEVVLTRTTVDHSAESASSSGAVFQDAETDDEKDDVTDTAGDGEEAAYFSMEGDSDEGGDSIESEPEIS